MQIGGHARDGCIPEDIAESGGCAGARATCRFSAVDSWHDGVKGAALNVQFWEQRIPCAIAGRRRLVAMRAFGRA